MELKKALYFENFRKILEVNQKRHIQSWVNAVEFNFLDLRR